MWSVLGVLPSLWGLGASFRGKVLGPESQAGNEARNGMRTAGPGRVLGMEGGR